MAQCTTLSRFPFLILVPELQEEVVRMLTLSERVALVRSCRRLRARGWIPKLPAKWREAWRRMAAVTVTKADRAFVRSAFEQLILVGCHTWKNVEMDGRLVIDFRGCTLVTSWRRMSWEWHHRSDKFGTLRMTMQSGDRGTDPCYWIIDYEYGPVWTHRLVHMSKASPSDLVGLKKRVERLRPDASSYVTHFYSRW